MTRFISTQRLIAFIHLLRVSTEMGLSGDWQRTCPLVLALLSLAWLSIKVTTVRHLKFDFTPTTTSPSGPEPLTMPKELPLEICMFFANEAFKECRATCDAKYKYYNTCCDTCREELMAKLRFCSRQSCQHFAVQIFRTIRFTDAALTRRFDSLVKDCVDVLPLVEELVVAFEDEGSDPQGT
jgi:hypothetical protein